MPTNDPVAAAALDAMMATFQHWLGNSAPPRWCVAEALDAANTAFKTLDPDPDRVAGVVKAAESGRLLDPRTVLTAVGRPPACTCPGGPTEFMNDFDPDCPRHGTTEPGRPVLAELLPVAREATMWTMGAWPDLCAPRAEQGPVPDGLLLNVLAAVLRHLCTPDEVR